MVGGSNNDDYVKGESERNDDRVEEFPLPNDRCHSAVTLKRKSGLQASVKLKEVMVKARTYCVENDNML